MLLSQRGVTAWCARRKAHPGVLAAHNSAGLVTMLSLFCMLGMLQLAGACRVCGCSAGSAGILIVAHVQHIIFAAVLHWQLFDTALLSHVCSWHSCSCLIARQAGSCWTRHIGWQCLPASAQLALQWLYGRTPSQCFSVCRVSHSKQPHCVGGARGRWR